MANRRFEVFEYRQVLVRMRQGDSDRDIARGGLMGRKKLTSVRREAESRGWLDPAQPLPDDTEIAGAFGRTPHLPSTCVSTVEPFREQIRAWSTAGVQGTTIHAALQRN
ncbi:IS21 family transposase, partial [Burkholderia stagnalis]